MLQGTLHLPSATTRTWYTARPKRAPRKVKNKSCCQRRGSNPRGAQTPEVLKTSPLDLSGTLAWLLFRDSNPGCQNVLSNRTSKSEVLTSTLKSMVCFTVGVLGRPAWASAWANEAEHRPRCPRIKKKESERAGTRGTRTGAHVSQGRRRTPGGARAQHAGAHFRVCLAAPHTGSGFVGCVAAAEKPQWTQFTARSVRARANGAPHGPYKRTGAARGAREGVRGCASTRGMRKIVRRVRGSRESRGSQI